MRLIRLYPRIPRRLLWIAVSAYEHLSALLAPRATARRRRLLWPFAARVGWQPRDLDHLTRATRVLMGLDTLLLKANDQTKTRHHIDVEGDEYFQAALAGGRGVVVAFDHVGFYHAAVKYLSDLGYHNTVIVPVRRGAGERRRPAYALLEYLRRVLWYDRNRMAGTSLAGTARTALDALRRGRAIMVAMDGAAGEQVLCTLMGTTVERAAGPFRLAHSTGAPVVVVSTVLGRDLRYRVRFYPPITLSRARPRADAVAEAAQTAARLMEQEYRASPWIVRRQMVEAIARADRSGRPTRRDVAADVPGAS